MKKLVFAFMLAAAACLAEGKNSTPVGFTDNLDAAMESAKASGKLIYACFSGSDWCGWCKRLDEEVLSKPEFLEALKDSYEFVYIDSPNDKSLLSERAKVENPKLTKQFAIRGFPTALVLDGEGKVVAKTGYRRGGAAGYVKYLKALRKNAVKLAPLNAEIERHQAEIQKLMEQVRAIENEE